MITQLLLYLFVFTKIAYMFFFAQNLTHNAAFYFDFYLCNLLKQTLQIFSEGVS